MSKAVLISIKPEWCRLIEYREKIIEVRRTKPKLYKPFKVYIYCTLPKNSGDIYLVGGRNPVQGNGKVIGEFMCNKIHEYYPIDIKDPINKPYGDEIEALSCLSTKEVNDYGYRTLGYGKLYGWYISDLVIYDKPKELNEFFKKCDEDCPNCIFWQYKRVNSDEFDMDCSSLFDGYKPIKDPPQSWCYVEEKKDV